MSFTWDLNDRAQRARYIWPRDGVMEWWRDGWDWDRLDATLQAKDKALKGPSWGRRARAASSAEAKDKELQGTLLKDSPACQAAFARQDTDLEWRFEKALGEWLTVFGRNEDEQQPLRWDPFHLPLFDPTTGDLSPKHPDYPGPEGWSDQARALFREFVLERMAAGMAANQRTPLQGCVFPPAFDLSVPEEERAEAPRVSADLSFALIGHDCNFSRRTFLMAPENGASGTTIQTYSARAALFGDGAAFRGARFGDAAAFGGAQFGDGADFERARFGDGADFERAQFGDRAFFWNAQFGDGAAFGKARFGDRAFFGEARFGDRAFFGEARFGDRANFPYARFGARADFSFTSLKMAIWRHVDCTPISFHYADLTDADLTNAKIWLDGGLIRGATFGPFSRNPWMAIVRGFTGSALVFNTLFLLAFFAPFLLKILAYYSWSVGISSGAIDPADLALAPVRESIVWREVLGGPDAPWIIGLSLFLLSYNMMRFWLTRRATALDDEFQRTGHAPKLAHYKWMVKFDRSFRLLIFAAIGVALWNLSRWLSEPLTVYGGL